MPRIERLRRLYRLLAELERKLGGTRSLAQCRGRMDWPLRGVYFFFEAGELRSDSGEGPRVVRVGTHALTSGSKSTLWGRLSQHRGASSTGGGNHRGSIFRLLVGEAMMSRDRRAHPESWGLGSDAGKAAARLGVTREEIKAQEQELEAEVSSFVGAMPFLWLDVADAPGPESMRGVIERNCVALLSNAGKQALDSPSRSWLGAYSLHDRVRTSGLWNNNHVNESYDPGFLDVLDELIGRLT